VSSSPEDEEPVGGRPLELSRMLGLDASRLADRRAFFEISARDEELLAELGGSCSGQLDRIVADFYAHLLRFPPLEDLLRAEPGRVAKLQGLQSEYFRELTAGRIDEAYVESRLRVGNAHQLIGLRPEWYIGAFSLFLRLYLRALVDARGEGAGLLPEFEALVKAVFLDMSLAIDTYIHGGFVNREQAAQLERATAIAEDALRVKQETERLKDDLTSMVVHDLKNPVNGIAMMVQLALRKKESLSPTHVGYLHQIQHTCGEMMRLIQNILEITKIEEGKMSVERESVSVCEVADEVGREYALVAQQAGRSIRIEVPADLPPITGDRALVKRVVINLVANALRHSGSQEVQIDGWYDPGGDLVTLRVMDHGTGFRLEDVPHVFEKFRSVQRSPTSEPAADTGLGLPFCKLAVELMGGAIGVESSPGVQTTFSVALPRARS
jgi:signal transduction histidine kinase